MAASPADVVPDVEVGPARDGKRVLSKVASYRFTTGDNDTQAIEAHLFDLDGVWSRPSPILAEWRAGRAATSRVLEPVKEACMNLFASVRIYFRYLVTAEAWILCLVSVASTLFFTMFEVKGRRLAVNVSWAFISFAIIFPLTNSLNETFRRRERALECIADVKAYLLSYYQAHRDWDWGENGRGKLPRNHVANVRLVLASCVADMRDVLTAPPTTRQIHYHTEWGRKERERVENMSHDMIFRISTYFDRMSLAVEELKYAGQPGNEASRMRQYVTLSMRAWENLKHIKKYRTPIATRAFARVYIFLHPWFWGPYYAYLVDGMVVDGTGNDASFGAVVGTTVYACALSVLTSLAMMGLFNVRYRMEDPFFDAVMEQTGKKNDTRQHLGVDLIHVAQEFAELLRSVAMEVVDADQNKCGGGPARRAYPLPESSWIAHLELKPGVEIVRIQSQV
jgi:hypothetical protein|tara:strand:- start:1905 stop:3260 length:1356 start_codon:yes stop_codon:yes gene_type:complete